MGGWQGPSCWACHSPLQPTPERHASLTRPGGGWLKRHTGPQKPREAACGCPPINCRDTRSKRGPSASGLSRISSPLGQLAHRIDLGEIIQLHFAFPCFGTLPAAMSALPEVRTLWTRPSPAVVNGSPYSLYEFPVNLQITLNTIALHLDSVLCLHVYLLPVSDYLVGCRQRSPQPLWAPVWEEVPAGGVTAAPAPGAQQAG